MLVYLGERPSSLQQHLLDIISEPHRVNPSAAAAAAPVLRQ